MRAEIVIVLEPSVALTMNEIVEPATTDCSRGTDSPGGLTIVIEPCPVLPL